MARVQERENNSGEQTISPRYRRFLHALKHAPARLSHPRRRRRAIARLECQGVPRSILVICVGNICRSPYAGAVLRRYLGDFLSSEDQIRSAGFIGPERPPPKEAIRVARSCSTDLSAHRSQPITEELVREAELIIVMGAQQERALRSRFPVGQREICVLGDLDPESIDTRDIRDPVEQDLRVFERSFARIDRCISELVKAVTRRTVR